MIYCKDKEYEQLWEERLWKFYTELYRDISKQNPDLKCSDASKVAYTEAVNAMNAFIDIEEASPDLNFHSELETFKVEEHAKYE